jgi:hypothetical protein
MSERNSAWYGKAFPEENVFDRERWGALLEGKSTADPARGSQ